MFRPDKKSRFFNILNLTPKRSTHARLGWTWRAVDLVTFFSFPYPLLISRATSVFCALKDDLEGEINECPWQNGRC
jgi:hypothetical protein